MKTIKRYAPTSNGAGPQKGTIGNPYAVEEMDAMLDNGTWQGGYVIGYGYVMREFIVNASSYSFGSVGISDGGFYFDNDFNNSIMGKEVGLNGGDYPDSCVDAVGMVLTTFDPIADAIGKYSGKTQVGDNLKLYFETNSGRVFKGNQYVCTTSLSAIGNSVHRVVMPANLMISAYKIINSNEDERAETVAKETTSFMGGSIGSYLGKYGSFLGRFLGMSTPGTILVSVVLSIIGSELGTYAGNYMVELLFGEEE